MAGRRKISMEKIEKRSRRDVTFSKRRSGAFKKADELTTICGAEVALIVFSPAGNPYSYGSPDVNTIVDRVMMGGGVGGGAPNNSIRALSERLNAIEQQLETEKERGEELERMRRAGEEENRRNWWRPEYSGSLGLPEIERLREGMEDLKLRTAGQTERLRMTTLSSGSSAGGPGPSSAAQPNIGGVVHPSNVAGTSSAEIDENQLIDEAMAIYNSLP